MSSASSRRIAAALLVALGLVLGAGTVEAQCPIPRDQFTPDPEFSSALLLKRCKFKTVGDNPFFPLRPDWQTVLESKEEVDKITVLRETRVVAGVRTRVVEELEFERDGDELVPVERSLNFFAYCEQTGSVVYFGEEVTFFDEEGNPVPGTGGWQAGRNGARPGIIMPGTILVGGGYYQEIASEDSALDKGRIVSVHKGCEVGEFDFKRLCVEIVDTSDCDPSAEDRKLYVRGVGNVADEDLEVTHFGFLDRHKHRDRDDDEDDD